MHHWLKAQKASFFCWWLSSSCFVVLFYAFCYAFCYALLCFLLCFITVVENDWGAIARTEKCLASDGIERPTICTDRDLCLHWVQCTRAWSKHPRSTQVPGWDPEAEVPDSGTAKSFKAVWTISLNLATLTSDGGCAPNLWGLIFRCEEHLYRRLRPSVRPLAGWLVRPPRCNYVEN
jgi:hypothetical protein